MTARDQSLKISVITVAYNAAGSIGETFDSIASQKYTNVEHVIIDGASQDGTFDIVQARLRPQDVAMSGPDRGIYDAMNKGITQASGDVIGFLNADDTFSDPEVLSDVAEAFRDPALDALYGDLVFVSGETNNPVRRYSSRHFSPARLASGWMPAHPTLYLRRHVFDDFGPMRIDYRIAADFEYCVRIFSSGRLNYRYLDRTMVRMRTGGVSTRGLGSTFTIVREIAQALRENNISVSWPGMARKYFDKATEMLPAFRR